MDDPLKNQNTFEMSRYIDLDVYHSVERSHPFYIEMVDEMKSQISSFADGHEKMNFLELGCGTGLLTEELVRFPNLDIDALELDSKCFEIIHRNMNGRVNCICGDAVTYCRANHYHMVGSSFAHDHIHYDRGRDFAENIRANLIRHGIYIMGGEILPYYNDDEQRKESLYTYHEMIIHRALREGHFRLAQIEINALESGIHMIGDFKRHEALFEREMLSADFRIKEKMKMGPLDCNDSGGVYVYVFEAI